MYNCKILRSSYLRVSEVLNQINNLYNILQIRKYQKLCKSIWYDDHYDYTYALINITFESTVE